MSRNIKILWEPERQLIDAYAGAPGAEVGSIQLDTETGEPVSLRDARKQARLNEVKNPANTKYRLKNGPASQESFGEVLRTLTADLERLENFWTYVMPSPDGSHHWTDVILPVNEREIRDLHRLLTKWLEIADVKRNVEIFDFDYTEEEWETIEGTLEPIVANQPEEIHARLNALTTLLLDEDLRDILFEIERTPEGRKLPDRKYGNITWKQAASSKLRNRYGLIENWQDWDYCYTLTPRGEAVHTTLNQIEEASIFENLDADEQMKRWLHLIGTGRGLP